MLNVINSTKCPNYHDILYIEFLGCFKKLFFKIITV